MGQARNDTGKWQIALHRHCSDAPSLARGRDEEVRERTDVPGEHIIIFVSATLEEPDMKTAL